MEFQDSTQLHYLSKGYSVFIQTDKAIYRPGNLIRDWDRVFTTKGVWAGSLEISPRPVLGNWNINVDVNGQIFTKEFQVAEYILPKFQVDVDIPTYATFTDRVTATIRANYALGRPVKGQATIAVYPRSKSGS